MTPPSPDPDMSITAADSSENYLAWLLRHDELALADALHYDLKHLSVSIITAEDFSRTASLSPAEWRTIAEIAEKSGQRLLNILRTMNAYLKLKGERPDVNLTD